MYDGNADCSECASNYIYGGARCSRVVRVNIDDQGTQDLKKVSQVALAGFVWQWDTVIAYVKCPRNAYSTKELKD